jgi:hypothetical protein
METSPEEVLFMIVIFGATLIALLYEFEDFFLWLLL